MKLEDLKKALRSTALEVSDQDLHYLLHDGKLLYITHEDPVFILTISLVEPK
jgi:hypothetical protein